MGPVLAMVAAHLVLFVVLAVLGQRVAGGTQ